MPLWRESKPDPGVRFCAGPHPLPSEGAARTSSVGACSCTFSVLPRLSLLQATFLPLRLGKAGICSLPVYPWRYLGRTGGMPKEASRNRMEGGDRRAHASIDAEGRDDRTSGARSFGTRRDYRASTRAQLLLRVQDRRRDKPHRTGSHAALLLGLP